MTRIFNFNAGPSMLPEKVLCQIKKELYNWKNLGISVMEISHRSEEFIKLAQETKQNLRELLDIPENYKILFCHGGARGQFSAVPMNLSATSSDHVDYINTGFWSHFASIEAKKYCNPNIINIFNNKRKLHEIQSISQWNISSNSVYIHYCPNETINGISIHEFPKFYDKIVVADCSSMLLSCPLDINCFGLIYASAQKNIGISGLTVVIIREDLLISSRKKIPSILNYKVLSDCNSMFNTPSTVSWYVANLVFKWLKEQGGVRKIYKRNKKKATLLYKYIDTSDFYYNNINIFYRSYMNIPFFLKDSKLENDFLNESLRFGLYGLKGHRLIGGMRASLYNSMTLEGVQKLIEFMQYFSEKHS